MLVEGIKSLEQGLVIIRLCATSLRHKGTYTFLITVAIEIIIYPLGVSKALL